MQVRLTCVHSCSGDESFLSLKIVVGLPTGIKYYLIVQAGTTLTTQPAPTDQADKRCQRKKSAEAAGAGVAQGSAGVAGPPAQHSTASTDGSKRAPTTCAMRDSRFRLTMPIAAASATPAWIDLLSPPAAAAGAAAGRPHRRRRRATARCRRRQGPT